MTIERFEKEYIEYHGLSTKRAIEQVNVLRAFEVHAGKPIIECGAVEFQAFLASLLSDEHVNTVLKKAGMIRPYFGWAFDAGLINGDTLMAVQRVKNPRGSSKKTKPNPYSSKELRMLWETLDHKLPYVDEKFLARWRRGTSPWTRVRQHAMHLQLEAILRLALDCGLRQREIFKASIDDIHPDNEYVVVRFAKRESIREEKTRQAPHTKASRIAIDRWLAFRSQMKPTHDAVWLSLHGERRAEPMSPHRFEKLIATQIGPSYGLHRCRHTCATLWLRSNVPLEKVQRLLGHASIAQTLCYADIVSDDIAAAMHSAEDIFEKLANAEDGHA